MINVGCDDNDESGDELDAKENKNKDTQREHINAIRMQQNNNRRY